MSFIAADISDNDSHCSVRAERPVLTFRRIVARYDKECRYTKNHQG